MPKEVIYGDRPPFAEESPARAVTEIHWNRDTGFVQIVTRCIHAVDHTTYKPSLEERGNPIPDPDEVLSYFDGFWVDLDRRGINDLIRNLRRARDQALGRDE